MLLPWELLSIDHTHPLASNMEFHIGNSEGKWLNNKFGRGVTMHLYQRCAASRGFFLALFCMATLSGKPKQASGQ
jgi:hypothetical protein